MYEESLKDERRYAPSPHSKAIDQLKTFRREFNLSLAWIYFYLPQNTFVDYLYVEEENHV